MDELRYQMMAYLDRATLDQVKVLENLCLSYEDVSLKLELDYKESLSNEMDKDQSLMNEFICTQGDKLVGYIGICGFDGVNLEVNGMVAPEYRRRGIFTRLMGMVKENIAGRREKELLMICDNRSQAGQEFILEQGVAYSFSEYEMSLTLDDKANYPVSDALTFRKASNDDVDEIASQNAIYFGKSIEEIDMPLPESEEQRGMTIYMASLGDEVIGKVNLQKGQDEMGLFGVGVRPEYRGRGFGRALINFGISTAHEVGVSIVYLQVEAKNEHALDLYLSCGFKVQSKMDYYSLSIKEAR